MSASTSRLLKRSILKYLSCLCGLSISEDAYCHETNGQFEIWSIAADGSDPARLTSHSPASVGVPAISPDGSKIAYALIPAGLGLYIRHRQSPSFAQSAVKVEIREPRDIAWHPDGTLIACSARQLHADPQRDIYTIDPKTMSVMNLTNSPDTYDSQPAWSPDGSKVIFTSVSSAGTERIAGIWVIGHNGADSVELARLDSKTRFHETPRWSPDGSQILFVCDNNGSPDIWVMDARGSNVMNLTRHLARDTDPRWSPDGDAVAFVSDREGGVFDIFVMAPDGTELMQLTGSPAHGVSPKWSPDGTKITFNSARTGSMQTYVMNRNGTKPVQLTYDGVNLAPVWSSEGESILFLSNRNEGIMSRILSWARSTLE